jgi:hypothetical protein
VATILRRECWYFGWLVTSVQYFLFLRHWLTNHKES